MSTVDDAPEDGPAPASGAQEAFRLRGDPPRVMRLSRKTLATLGIAGGLCIGGALIYALQPRSPTTTTNLYATDNPHKADVVTAAPSDYATAPKLGPALPGDLGRPILSAQANGRGVPVPAMGSGDNVQGQARVAGEQQRQRVAQERDAARGSRLFLGGDGGSSARDQVALPSAGGGVSPSAGTTVPTGASTSTVAPGAQDSKRAFLQSDADRVVVSSARLSAPVSTSIVQAGSIIAAALITGIRSDLPGQITAQVTQNVYDSPTGHILLIPQGARLIGNYDSNVSAGQNRVLLAWDRLIFADGRSLMLDRQPGADPQGFAGLQDATNYHWGNLLKATLVSTLLGIGSESATSNDDELMRALRYGTQDTINQTGRQLVQREINVPPTLTIRPGFPLRVLVTRDLVLEPIAGER